MIREILDVLGLSSVSNDLAFAVGSLWLWWLIHHIFDFVLTLIKSNKRR